MRIKIGDCFKIKLVTELWFTEMLFKLTFAGIISSDEIILKYAERNMDCF